MKFLYTNNKSIVEVNDFQKKSINDFLLSIEKKEIKFLENSCLCNNYQKSKDVLITDKDRYGIPFKNYLCSKCGLIRSAEVFDKDSNIIFYQKYYRDIYVGSKIPDDFFFSEQSERGEVFLNLLKSKIEIKKESLVAEIGCGAGGILSAFQKAGYETIGIDYDKEYLAFGIKKGCNLFYGNYNDILIDDSVDILILSHVMEHFANVVQEVQKSILKVKENGYLLVEVPGIFSIKKMYFNPLSYFQNAHIYNFYHDYLKVFFETLGLKIVYGDERCTFILQKPQAWQKSSIDIVYDDCLKEYPKKIKKFIIRQNFLYTYSLHPYVWKLRIVAVLDHLKIKKIVKKIFHK